MSLRSILTNLTGFCNPTLRGFTAQLDVQPESSRTILRGLVHGRNMARRASYVVRGAGYDNNAAVIYDHSDIRERAHVDVVLEHEGTSPQERSSLYRTVSDEILPGHALPRQAQVGDITFGVPSTTMEAVSPTYDTDHDLPVQISFSSQPDLTPRTSYYTTGWFELGHSDITNPVVYS